MAWYTSKPHDEISTKAQNNREIAMLRNDLKRIQEDYDQEGKFNEAVERYKFIYTQAMGKDLQNIASDAEAFKVNFIIIKFCREDWHDPIEKEMRSGTIFQPNYRSRE